MCVCTVCPFGGLQTKMGVGGVDDLVFNITFNIIKSIDTMKG